MVPDIHGRIDREQEKADPQLVKATQQFRIGSHDQCKGLAVGKLVITPLQKPFKNRMKALLGMALKVSIDRDVACVADLFRKIRGVINIFGLEEGVLLLTLQHPEVNSHTELVQRFIDETGVSRFIPRHIAHQLGDVGVANVFLDLLVEHTTRVLRGDGGDEQIEKLFFEFGVRLQNAGVVLVVLLEVAAVRVELEVAHHQIPLCANGLDVDMLHCRVVGAIESGRQRLCLQRLLCGQIDRPVR